MDRNARIEQARPLVRRVALQFQTRLPAYITLDELISAGHLGLVEAVDRYDDQRGVTFTAFARTRIRGAMADWLRGLDIVPRSTRDRLNQLEEVARTAEQELGRAPSLGELARRMNLSVQQLQTLRRDGQTGQVLGFDDLARDSEANSPLDRLADERVQNADSVLLTRELHARMRSCVAELPERLRLVVTLYYTEEMKMQEIAILLGVTVGRVSQLHTEALHRLRNGLGEHEDYDSRQLELLLGLRL